MKWGNTSSVEELCLKCKAGFYKSSNYRCEKCIQNLWILYPAVLALISFLILAGYAFGVYLKPWADALSLALRKHELLLALLGEQLTRLILLKRLPTIKLPLVFSNALGYYAVFFGLNTLNVGFECATAVGTSWTFASSFLVTLIGSVGLCLLSLLLDFHNRMRGLIIPVPQWHVFDAIDFALPMSHQAAWQALTTFKRRDGETVMLYDLMTNFNDANNVPVITAAICVIVFSFGFTIIRYWLARCIPCRAMVSDNTNPRQRSGRFLAETTTGGQVMRRRDDGLKVLQIGNEEANEFAMFNACRALLNIIRTLSIIMISYDNVDPSVFLLGVSGLEFLLVWRVTSARAFIVRSGGQALSATLFSLFVITNSVGVGCYTGGGCESQGFDAVGSILIIANAILFFFITKPIVHAMRANLIDLNNQPLSLVYATDREVDPVQGVTDSTPDAKFILISYGKPVVSSTLPRARPQAAAATRPRPRETSVTRSPRLAPLPSPKFSSPASLDDSAWGDAAPTSAPSSGQPRGGAAPSSAQTSSVESRSDAAAPPSPTTLQLRAQPPSSWVSPVSSSMRRLISSVSRSSRTPVPVPRFSSSASERSLPVSASAAEPRAPDARDGSSSPAGPSPSVFRTPSGDGGGGGGISRANSIRMNPLDRHSLDEAGRPLADGWTRVTDPTDGVVFYTHAVEPSRWEPPLRDSFVPGDCDERGRPLAHGWTRAVDVGDGAVYYVHAVEAARWDPPLRE